MKRRRARSRLRHLCTQAGVPLSWLARESGVTLDALQKIASGRRQPLVTTALRIAEALGVEVEELVVTSDYGTDGLQLSQRGLLPLTNNARRHRR
jgi:transcriptional regulator with XRE-family HTH domain